MLLGFKKYVNGQPTHFKEKILACVFKNGYTPKLHTIRKSKRFMPGTKLHMAYGVRTKFYEQFNYDIPELEKCVSTQEIRIEWFLNGCIVWVDDRALDEDEITELARNDGFNSLIEFLRYFNENFEGQIIHWTDLRY